VIVNAPHILLRLTMYLRSASLLSIECEGRIRPLQEAIRKIIRVECTSHEFQKISPANSIERSGFIRDHPCEDSPRQSYGLSGEAEASCQKDFGSSAQPRPIGPLGRSRRRGAHPHTPYSKVPRG
jgi:hypothetical protein